MEAPVFDPETFNKTVLRVRALGAAQEVKNESVLEFHNKAYFELGGNVSSQLPDTAEVDNYLEVGKAVVDLISTIPGVSTEGMLQKVSNPNSIALSDRAISARLRYAKGTEVGVYLSLDKDIGSYGRKFYFDRIDPQKRYFRIDIRMDLNGVPKRGQVETGKSSGNGGISVDETIDFDVGGHSLTDSPQYEISKGDKFDIVKLIQEVTSPDNMDQPFDAKVVLNRCLQPKLTKVD